ncbi:MAG: release factor glutamine methyltransferase [Candidatus Berkelbacteria bacterium Gr01-1014_85]|uniref:Release factor glutamine methyltransferase n=1 Tax=Candidatus Berkelbacteria bacterium Gr01-1014_85 TaxID=2017150 RepID=A0A554JAD8_9BACT|nr:MAG: release factor glutamine methyltransferase [Candidatus Berkelbacteria bacterium Gr01-1014_85]
MPKLGQWLYQQEQAWRTLKIADAYPACRELAATVLDCQPSTLPALLDHELTASELDWLTDAAARHTDGEPIGRILKQIRLFDRTWNIADQSLIPRADSYPLILMAKRALEQSPTTEKLIELGTGCGWLLIQLLVELETNNLNELRLIGGSDLEPIVLETAEQNAKRHLAPTVADSLQWRAGNLIEPWPELRSASPTFSKALLPTLILANLPYLSQSQYDTLEPSVKKHEPAEALVGGLTGNEIYLQLIEELLKLPTPVDLILETNSSNRPGLIQAIQQSISAPTLIVEHTTEPSSQTECIWLRFNYSKASSVSLIS